MAPKKQKMSLNDFLADDSLGSWADEMDNLPTAPAFRAEDAARNRGGDRGFGDRPDRGFASDRGDRQQFPPREDLPLPTEPPYTAFIGNLPFDLTEGEIEEHFGPHKVKSVKIITDKKDGKPKGFGYIEFEELDGLKDAMAKSGSSLAGRVVRVSVAEPPKERERGGFGSGGGFDDEKYSGDWRRTGPLPIVEERRGSRPGPSREDSGFGGSRFQDREPGPPSAAESAGDWRSSRPAPSPRLGTNLVPDVPAKRRSSGISTPTDGPSAADTEEVWTMGSKFKRSPPASVAGGTGGTGGPPGAARKFSSGRGEMGPPSAPSAADEGDWRSGPRRPANAFERSPTNSTPPTPNMGRKKLELLPRSGGGSAVPSPLSSPKFAAATPVARANPFGAARPIDVSAREKEVAERIERKEKDLVMRRVPSSRPSSRAPSERAHSPPPGSSSTTPTTPSGNRFTAATVRPAVSFANAAKAKAEAEASKAKGDKVEDITGGVKEITV